MSAERVLDTSASFKTPPPGGSDLSLKTELSVSIPRRGIRRRWSKPLAKLAAFTVATGMGLGGVVVGGAAIAEKSHLVSSAEDAVFGPGNEGRIILDKARSYNFVGIGDSLAAGVGGEQESIAGIKRPKSWIEPLVADINERFPGKANHEFISNLAKSGSSVADLNERLEAQINDLIHMPNLVLCMSAVNKDVEDFTEIIQEAGNPSSAEKLEILNESMSGYSARLKATRRILRSIQEERKKALAIEQSSMQVVSIGLPRMDEVKRVKEEIIDKHVVSKGEAIIIADLFNRVLRDGMRDGNDEEGGINYAYVDLTGHAIKPKYISNDNFHPNQDGYKVIATDGAKVIYMATGEQGLVVGLKPAA